MRLSLFLLLALAALPAQSQKPETIYTHATIWTGVPGAPRAEALAVGQGKILAVGPAAEVAKLAGPETKTVDLGGRFVVPGLIDTHTHFHSGGFQLASVDLRGATSREEFTHRLAAFARTLPPGKWITGGDWDHEAWGGELPWTLWIDQAAGDHPVFINRLDGHMALANTKALELAGITRDTPDPPGGLIVRDPRSRVPTGILKDEAMALVSRLIPAPTDAERDEALERAMRHAASLGVTQVHDMGTWEDLAAGRRAAAKDALLLRLYAFVPLDTWPRLAELVKKEGRGDDWLRWGGLKGFVDGSLGSTTAWFHEPYTDAPDNRGLVVTESARLAADIKAGDAAGLQVAVHAIGDRANDWLLDTFAEAVRARPGERRFRIEHAQHLSPAAIERFARQGVIPSMQPYHAIDDGRWAEKRIGPVRIQTTYAFRSLLDTKAPLAFGSDWTVAPLSPLEGIYAAVTRRTIDGKTPAGWVPTQKITVEEALRAYTAGGAWAGFQEDRLGTLEPGKLADFVVLSEDLFKIDPVAIREVKVLRTVVGGRESYRAE